MRTIDLADVQISIPDGKRGDWKNPEYDPSGQKKDNYGDIVKFIHEPTGIEIQQSARTFGQAAVAQGIADLVNAVADSGKSTQRGTRV